MIESKMEELLIKQLTHGVSQWTYRPDLRTEEALWNNLREKLNRNNIDKLQGIPLTALKSSKAPTNYFTPNILRKSWSRLVVSVVHLDALAFPVAAT